nr:hypothetical protein [Bacilli bacterium]
MNLKTGFKTVTLAATTFITSTLPAFAAVAAPPPVTGVAADGVSGIAGQAQLVYQELQTSAHLATIQGVLVVVLVFLVIHKATKAAHEQATTKIWQTIAFGLVGLILIIDPLILINLALWAGSFVGA